MVVFFTVSRYSSARTANWRTISDTSSIGRQGLWHDIRRIEDLDDFRPLRAGWDELAASSDHLLCMTYAYNELTASSALAAGARIELIMVHDGPESVAIWPFVIKRMGPFKVARTLTCGNREEYSRPLIRYASPRVYNELVRAVLGIDADALQLSHVDDDSLLARFLSKTPQGRWLPSTATCLPGYSIKFDRFPTWESYEASLPKSLRDIVRRRQRQINRLGHVEIQWCRAPDETVSVLVWLFETKRRWAESREKNAPWLKDNKVRDFYVALTHRLDLSTTPLVACVRVNGIPIAAAVASIGSDLLEWSITGYDERFGKYSPGQLLINFLVRWAYDNHLDFDFRPLDADYKSRWSTHSSNYRSLTLFLSFYGRMLEGLLMARRHLHGRQRRVLIQRPVSWPDELIRTKNS